MPPRSVEPLEAALARADTVLGRCRTTEAALDAATSPAEMRLLAARAERDEAALNDADNALGESVAVWAEAACSAALANVRTLLGPAFQILAACEAAGADTPSLGALRDLADALELEPKLDPDSDAGRLGARVCEALARLDRALGAAA